MSGICSAHQHHEIGCKQCEASLTAHSRLNTLTRVGIEAVDAKLKHQPIEPVLRLWEDLRDVGDMPPMKPEHVRAMAWALWKAREKLD